MKKYFPFMSNPVLLLIPLLFLLIFPNLSTIQSNSSIDILYIEQTSDETYHDQNHIPQPDFFELVVSSKLHSPIEPVESSRPHRNPQRPKWMDDYVCHLHIYFGMSKESKNPSTINETEPVSFGEAYKESIWRKAMPDELNALERNHS